MKLCECGCGKPAPLASRTRTDRGQKQGQPVRFIKWHSPGSGPPEKHGHANRGHISNTYLSWEAARRRCYYKTNNRYKHYGAKGIKMCERWHDFANFLVDMGEKPPRTSLGRYWDSGDYEPGNCKWMTRAEQEEHKWRRPEGYPKQKSRKRS
jgi:hypothetical protein